MCCRMGMVELMWQNESEMTGRIHDLFVNDYEVIRDTTNKQSRKSGVNSNHCCASTRGRNAGPR
jgi:hypothetical protein